MTDFGCDICDVRSKCAFVLKHLLFLLVIAVSWFYLSAMSTLQSSNGDLNLSLNTLTQMRRVGAPSEIMGQYSPATVASPTAPSPVTSRDGGATSKLELCQLNDQNSAQIGRSVMSDSVSDVLGIKPISAESSQQFASATHGMSPEWQSNMLSGYNTSPSPLGMVGGSRPNVGENDDSTRKRQVRLLKNREAAKECRRKKKEYVKCLENRVSVLENQNKALIEELKTLKELYCRKEKTEL
ncbi:hypothetical protein AB6A40_009280 [Gnathostoma spinigerum]|uniref:BZIP domain-containing protein n=1 Tax=Gnathostoma spinigerum TaxID=75299 RepID=A0ABD6EYN6_9BILA